MYYYKARYYHAGLGRFLSVDPVGYDDQMNLYAYVANAPLLYRDPSGKAQDLGLGTLLAAKMMGKSDEETIEIMQQNIHAKTQASMFVLEATRVGVAIDVIDIGLKIRNGQNILPKTAGMSVGAAADAISNSLITYKFGSSAADAISPIVGHVAGSKVESYVANVDSGGGSSGCSIPMRCGMNTNGGGSSVSNSGAKSKK